MWPSAIAALLAVVVVVVVAMVVSDDADAPGGAVAGGGITGGDFHSLVADPTRPDRLFVGGHQAVSMSDDGGGTWVTISGLDDADAMGWAFIDDRVWVSGHPGITSSTAGMEGFERRNDGLPDSDIHALGAAGESLIAAGPAVGTIGSIDGGVTWEPLSQGHGQSFFGRIAADAADPSHLVAADAAAGPVESRDGGRTWTLLKEFPVAWVSASDDLDVIVASGPSGAIRSSDGGVTWEAMELPAGATLVELDPHVGGRVFAGVHDGDAVTVRVSLDNGATWGTP